MADRNTLATLIEAVESGHDDEVDGLACALFHGSGQCRDVVSAYTGSLDAALALHEVLLPGWHYRITRGKHTPEAIVQRDILAGEYASAELELPARAWLLAVLRALAEKEEQG